ncbi:hypothetical protein GCM10009865_06180 [Aeromicrobium ponti]|uniref:L-proline dehydrogenase n=1 Tax=Cytobacillus oceanisediminis TaxID=665099 RepID=A0A562K6L4_9BACI|nr:L-proline dehydrogenase [Cytobacillus oceanisediminis]
MNISSRSFFLYLSKNKALNRAAQNWGGNIAAGKIIGGTDFPSSIPFIRTLNEQGLAVTVDHLGEFVTNAAVARERTDECIRTIEMIASGRLK